MPSSHIVKAVVKAVESIDGHKDMTALDISCGEGEVIRELKDKFFRIEGTHYREDDYILKNPLPILEHVGLHANVALDNELPFEDESYDLVLMTEVIEHIPNHLLAMKEVARILKSGGYLILTTPNTSRLHSRLNFFMTGSHKLIRRRIGWDCDMSSWHEHHVNPVDFPIFHSLLHILGLDIESIRTTRIKKHRLYLMLAYPLVWIASLCEYFARTGEDSFRKGESDLFRKMTSFPLLFSEQLLVVARKKA